MRQLNFYTQKAINRYNLNGQNALAREIGIAGATLSQFLNGKALPSEETMIKLAELAGLPKEEALIDLNLWRSKDKPELQKIWQHLSKMIGCFAFPLLAFSGITGLPTLSVICLMMYVMYNKE